MECEYGVHWLSFVVEGATSDAYVLYDLFFGSLFGQLQDAGHGGRGFDHLLTGLLGFKVYLTPSAHDKEYFHFEIPGDACELAQGIFHDLDNYLRRNYPGRYHYTRFDFAFDNLPFQPQDVEMAIKDGKVRSLAKRESLTVINSPFEICDNGKVGTYTVSFGSRQSERMIRVYNRRGYVRLEIEYKEKRADLVAKDVLSRDASDWFSVALSHLLDYVDFPGVKWWSDFVAGSGRAWVTLSSPSEITEKRLSEWMERQVSAALSVLCDIGHDKYLDDLLRLGRVKRRLSGRYNSLLSITKK